VLDYILRFVQENGYQPSTAEMARHFKVHRKAIADRIKQLASKGVVGLQPLYRERCLELRGVKFAASFSRGPAGPPPPTCTGLTRRPSPQSGTAAPASPRTPAGCVRQGTSPPRTRPGRVAG
jgi:hypothetical protein